MSVWNTVDAIRGDIISLVDDGMPLFDESGGGELGLVCSVKRITNGYSTHAFEVLFDTTGLRKMMMSREHYEIVVPVTRRRNK